MEESLLDDLYIPPVTFPDLHLKSALLKKPTSLFRLGISDINDPKLPTFCKNSSREFIQSMPGIKPRIKCQKLYPKFWELTTQPDKIITSIEKTALKIAKTQTSFVCNILFTLLVGITGLVGKTHIITKLLSFLPTDHSIGLSSTRYGLESLRNAMHKKRQDSDFTWGKFTLPIGSISNILYNSHFFVFQIEPAGENIPWYVLDYDHLLMLHDTVISRFLSYFYCRLYNHTYKHQTVSAITLQELYEWGDNLLKKLGNDAYDVIKFLESLCVGHIIKDDADCPIAKRFRMNMIVKAGEKNLKTFLGVLQLDSLLSKLENKLSILELYGVYRHWGHPDVNVEQACAEQKTNTRTKPKFNRSTLRDLLGAFNRTFIINFIKIQGRWPACYISDRFRHYRLYKIVTSHDLSYHDFEDMIPFYEWAAVIFENEFNFDMHSNFTSLIDDKAISVERNEYLSVYNPNLLGFRPQPPSTSRRVILETLKRSSINISEICFSIMNRSLPDAWKVIGMHPKERELKIKPRLFAMMTLEMRLYFCVTEKNLADTMFKYFPQQTMTTDEATLIKRFFQLTGLKSIEYSTVTISIDFVTWCQKWRWDSTSGIFQQIDRLFGTPGLLEYTHEFFETAFFYLSSSLHPPDNVSLTNTHPETRTTWTGQLGGCEGLRQKGWTLITIAMLVLIERKTGIKSLITGQGDNQVIILFIPKTQDIESTIINYMTVLSDISQDIGLEIKVTETYCSSSFLLYGKEPVLNGVMMPMVLKRISRAFPDVSEHFPTLATKLASICTTGQAAALKGLEPLVPYYIVIYEVIRTFLKESQWSLIVGGPLFDRRRLTDECLLCLVNLSRSLGSYPILPFVEYLYRGHPDPLTSTLGSLKIFSSEHPIIGKIIYWVKTIMKPREKEDPKMLIQDPTSLNHQIPIMSSNIVKNQITQSLMGSVENISLKDLFNMEFSEEEEYIINKISSIRPSHPRVWNDIFSCTVPGTKAAFLAKFNNLRTSKQLLSNQTQNTLLSRVKTSERKMIEFIITMLITISKCKTDTIDCSSVLAQQLRDQSWKTYSPICGVTVPHPIEQTMITEAKSEMCSQCHQDPEHIEIYLQEISGYRPLTRGSNDVYIGSRTVEKTSSPTMTVDFKDNAYKAAQRLYRIREWLSEEASYLRSFLTDLIETRTDVNNATLSASTGISFGGSPTHRFADKVVSHAAIVNHRPNINTQCYLSSDNLGKYSRGFDNYSMHFQGIFLFNISLLNIISCLIPESTDGKKYYHIHLPCCIHQVHDEQMDCDDTHKHLTVLKANHLVFSTAENIIPFTTWLNSGMIKMHSPTSHTINIREKAAESLVCSIMSVASRLSGSQVHTSTVTSASMGGIRISVGEFLSLGLKTILTAFSRLWILDNYDMLLHYSITRGLRLEDSLRILLLRTPDLYWEGIKQYLPLKEAVIQLIHELGILPSHAEALKGGRGMDITLMKWVFKKVSILLNKPGQLVTVIHTPQPSFPIQRILKNWFNGLVMNLLTNKASNEMKLELISQCKEIIHKDPTMSISNLLHWMLLPPVSDILDLSQTNLYAYFKLHLSSSGTDSWIAHAKTLGPNDNYRNTVHRYSPIDTRLSTSMVVSVQLPSSTDKAKIKIQIPANEEFSLPQERYHTREDHQFRLMGLFSTAAYKYMEIIIKLNLTAYIFLRNVFNGAEGAGGVSKLCGNMFSARKIFFNSLLKVHDFMPHRASSYIPAELLSLNEDVVLLGIRTAMITGGDLTDINVINNYVDLIKIDNSKISFYTCDAEISSNNLTDMLKMARNLVYLIENTSEDKWCLCFKTYCHDLKYLMIQIQILSELSDNVKLIVPTCSSYESYEIFIVIEGESIYKNYHLRETPTHYYGSMDNYQLINILQSIVSHRLGTTPFQNNEEIIKYHLALKRGGFINNFNASMDLLSKNLWQEMECTSTAQVFKKIRDTKNIIHKMIEDRVISHKKLVRAKKLSKIERILIYKKWSDHIEIEGLLESLISLSLILHPGETSYYRHVNLMNRRYHFFTYNKTYQQWGKKNNRYVERVLGHLRLTKLTHNPLVD